MYQDNEAKLTGEGDNNMILQQTSKFLLKAVSQGLKTQLFDVSYLYEDEPVK